MATNVSIKISQLKRLTGSYIDKTDYIPVVDSASVRTYRMTLGDLVDLANKDIMDLLGGDDQEIYFNRNGYIDGDSSLQFNYTSQSLQHGFGNSALGNYSHAEGYFSIANGAFSHTEGNICITTGSYSHAEGYSTVASGNYSHAEGVHTLASGIGSHAGGYYTVANGDYQTVIGKYNKTYPINTTSLFIIGGGSSDIARKDLLIADTSGISIDGNVNFTGQLTENLNKTINITSSKAISSSYALTASYLAGGMSGDSVWSLNGPIAYYNIGKVGIGISTPTNQLDVIGDIGATGLISSSGINSSGDISTTTGYFRGGDYFTQLSIPLGGSLIIKNVGDSDDGIILSSGADSVTNDGLDININGANLNIPGDININAGDATFPFGVSNGGNINISTGNSTATAGNLIITTGTGATDIGKVGINVSNPQNLLDVAGNISCSNITASLLNGTASWANSSYYALNAASAQSIPYNTQLHFGDVLMFAEDGLTLGGGLVVIDNDATLYSVNPITASLNGTASWANNVISASHALTASYLSNTASHALTASYLSNTASWANYSITSSYALTASYGITNYITQSVESSSYASQSFYSISASWASSSISSSWATNAKTASYLIPINNYTVKTLTASNASEIPMLVNIGTYGNDTFMRLSRSGSSDWEIRDPSGIGTWLEFHPMSYAGDSVVPIFFDSNGGITADNLSSINYLTVGASINIGDSTVFNRGNLSYGVIPDYGDIISDGVATFGGGFVTNDDSGEGIIISNGTGSIAIGAVYSVLDSYSKIESIGYGSIAMGRAGIGNNTGETSTISSTGFGSVAIGYANNGIIESTGAGSVAMGYSENGTLSAIGQGSFALGDNVQANSNNTFAVGRGFANNTANSFKVGFGSETFSVQTGSVNIIGQLVASRITSSFSGSLSGSLYGTASWATNVSSLTASYVSGSNVHGAVPTAENAMTASNLYVTNNYKLNNLTASNISASGYITASKGFYGNLSGTASNSKTSSYLYNNFITIDGAGYILTYGNISSSGKINATSVTASLLGTASWANNSISASSSSYALSSSYGLSSSYAITASYVKGTSSYAMRANSSDVADFAYNFAEGDYGITSSWSHNSISSAYASTSAYALNGIIDGNTYNITSSWATHSMSSSYALTASYAMNSGNTTILTQSAYFYKDELNYVFDDVTQSFYYTSSFNYVISASGMYRFNIATTQYTTGVIPRDDVRFYPRLTDFLGEYPFVASDYKSIVFRSDSPPAGFTVDTWGRNSYSYVFQGISESIVKFYYDNPTGDGTYTSGGLFHILAYVSVENLGVV